MGLKIIIDSGSTKSDWAVLNNSQETIYATTGINPAKQKTLLDLESIDKNLKTALSKADAIYYYGAGVFDIDSKNRIENMFTVFVPKNCNIQIESDILGAARATAKNNKAIVCILGTGSNSCLFDGTNIMENIPTLGYILSDEGGGVNIGKSILKSYLYDTMPTEVRIKFEGLYTLNKKHIIKKLYKEENPNTYLATFTYFLKKSNHQKWNQSILDKNFQEFVDIRIKGYKGYQDLEIYFIGSIAHYFRDSLKAIFTKNNLKLKTILKRPIEGLIAYHK
ncbi:MAG: BadF/BadG/BcrA/BcrD ATPase family protein [Saprospiraceae bacterium]